MRPHLYTDFRQVFNPLSGGVELCPHLYTVIRGFWGGAFELIEQNVRKLFTLKPSRSVSHSFFGNSKWSFEIYLSNILLARFFQIWSTFFEKSFLTYQVVTKNRI